MHKAIDDALSNVELGEYGELFAAIDQNRVDRGELMQGIAGLWNERGRLADLRRRNSEANSHLREAEADKIVNKVKADYERMGSGLAAMPAYGTNGESAEQQLDFLARNRNVRAKKAFGAVEDVVRIDAAAGASGGQPKAASLLTSS